MKILVLGNGRMGTALAAQVRAAGHALLGPSGREGAPQALWEAADAAIDFSVAEAVEEHVDAAMASDTPLVVGTTGWREREDAVRERVERAGGCVVVGANFSLGFQVLRRLTRDVARWATLIPGADVWVEERHHRGKRDAPSGSALALADVLLNGLPGKQTVEPGAPRGAIPSDALHVVSTRSGSEPGLHRVGLDTPLETVEVEHRVRDRSVFAAGALFAAERLQGRTGWIPFETLVDTWMTEEER